MNKIILFIVFFLSLALFTSCSGDNQLDRSALVSLMEQYLEALAKHDPFKIFVADSVAGQVGFMGVIEENNRPTILGARLKVVNGKITEIDHLVVHSGDQPMGSF